MAQLLPQFLQHRIALLQSFFLVQLLLIELGDDGVFEVDYFIALLDFMRNIFRLAAAFLVFFRGVGEGLDVLK